jgi:hypothetical protein
MKSNFVVQALQSVDWLTMTCKRSGSRNSVELIASNFLRDSAETGSDVGQWERYGYQGWYCNGMRWGRREQDDILQLSSDTAGLLWNSYLIYADNVSRVDLAVTLKFAYNFADFISHQWNLIKEKSSETNPHRTYHRTEGLKEGYTIYVGSRASANFGRLYDKQAESKNAEHWLNTLRWEVEFKKPLAWEVGQELMSTGGGGNYIYQRVYRWFTDRDISVPNLDLGVIDKLSVPRRLMPDEKRLEWLNHQVRPTVEKLAHKGRKDEVLKALGLFDDNTNK